MRQLRKSPGFALVAGLTLALGIGGNTVMFIVVDTVLLRPFAYYQPDRLALVSETLNSGTNDDYGVAAQEYLDYRERNHAFSEVAAFEQDGFNLGWRQSHIATQPSLKDSTQTGTWRTSLRLQNAVAVGEIALALMLLIAGSLLLRSFAQ